MCSVNYFLFFKTTIGRFNKKRETPVKIPYQHRVPTRRNTGSCVTFARSALTMPVCLVHRVRSIISAIGRRFPVAVCVCVLHIKPFFRPVDIQQNQCPCRFFNFRRDTSYVVAKLRHSRYTTLTRVQYALQSLRAMQSHVIISGTRYARHDIRNL